MVRNYISTDLRRFIYIGLLLLLSSSCEDYLDIKPRGSEVACKVEHYEGLLFGPEVFMLDETFPYMTFEWDSDHDGFLNFYAATGTAATNAFMWRPDIYREDETCGEWNTFANFLYACNIVVNEVLDAEDGTQEERLALQSEARMARAWYTFLWAQFFGKPFNASTASTDLCVPIVTTASTTGGSFPRRTVQEVYDFVLNEMRASLPYLPDEDEHPNRIFAITGHAMLGKVLWMMGRYDEALEPLGKAVSLADGHPSTGFQDYNTMMTPEGELDTPINILEDPERLFDFQSMAFIMPVVYAVYYDKMMIRLKNDIMLQLFSKEDTRLAMYSGLKSGQTAYARLSATEIYTLGQLHFATQLGITVPDTWLMYGECLARQGQNEEARRILEELRLNRLPATQASVPADVVSDDDLVRFAVQERMREYFGYGNLWFDMRRLWNDPLFQDLKPYYTHTDGEQTVTLTEQRLTMRIPPQIMAWHPEYENND